jgi:hypothetical protein
MVGVQYGNTNIELLTLGVMVMMCRLTWLCIGSKAKYFSFQQVLGLTV